MSGGSHATIKGKGRVTSLSKSSKTGSDVVSANADADADADADGEEDDNIVRTDHLVNK